MLLTSVGMTSCGSASGGAQAADRRSYVSALERLCTKYNAQTAQPDATDLESLKSFAREAAALSKPPADAARINSDFETPLATEVNLLAKAQRLDQQAQSSKDPKVVAESLRTLDLINAPLLKMQAFFRSIGATKCVDPAVGGPSQSPAAAAPVTGKPTIRYQVRLRDGGSVNVTVRYRLPSGQLQELHVRTPWSGDQLTFGSRAELFVSATTSHSVSSPLLCILSSVPPDQGAWSGGRVTDSATPSPDSNSLGQCATQYVLGDWPPAEDDPDTGNLLIRVG